MASINGRVVDYDNDSPIPGVTVTLYNDKTKTAALASATTSADGTYTLVHSSINDPYVVVDFSAPGYATQTMRVPSAIDTDVVLPKAGTLAAVTITIKRNKTKVIIAIAITAVIVYLFIKYRSKIKI